VQPFSDCRVGQSLRRESKDRTFSVGQSVEVFDVPVSGQEFLRNQRVHDSFATGDTARGIQNRRGR
jgi:hypothetical protein